MSCQTHSHQHKVVGFETQVVEWLSRQYGTEKLNNQSAMPAPPAGPVSNNDRTGVEFLKYSTGS